jgi:hypothetical protein
MPLLATPLVSLCILVAVIVIVALIITIARHDIRKAVKEAIRETFSGYRNPGLAGQDFPKVTRPTNQPSEAVNRDKAEHIDQWFQWEKENRAAFSVLDDEHEGVPIEAIWQDELDDEDNERRNSKSYPHCLR